MATKQVSPDTVKIPAKQQPTSQGPVFKPVANVKPIRSSSARITLTNTDGIVDIHFCCCTNINSRVHCSNCKCPKDPFLNKPMEPMDPEISRQIIAKMFNQVSFEVTPDTVKIPAKQQPTSQGPVFKPIAEIKPIRSSSSARITLLNMDGIVDIHFCCCTNIFSRVHCSNCKCPKEPFLNKPMERMESMESEFKRQIIAKMFHQFHQWTTLQY